MLNYRLEGLLTVEKLAERLSVKISMVRDWIARRKVPFTRFQRRVYFHAGVIEQMLQRAQVPALTASQDQRFEQGGERPGRCQVNTAKSFVIVGQQGRNYRVYVNGQTGYWFVSFMDGSKRRRESLKVMTRAEAEHAVKLLDGPRVEVQEQQHEEMTWEEFVLKYVEYKRQQGKAPRSLARFKSGLAACGRYLASIGIPKLAA